MHNHSCDCHRLGQVPLLAAFAPVGRIIQRWPASLACVAATVTLVAAAAGLLDRPDLSVCQSLAFAAISLCLAVVIWALFTTARDFGVFACRDHLEISRFVVTRIPWRDVEGASILHRLSGDVLQVREWEGAVHIVRPTSCFM